MAIFAVVDKAGFQRWLDPGDHGFVNVAFTLLAAFDFNLVVQQFLAIHNGQAFFFHLRGINQHAFHAFLLMRLFLKPLASTDAVMRQQMPERTRSETRELP